MPLNYRILRKIRELPYSDDEKSALESIMEIVRSGDSRMKNKIKKIIESYVGDDEQ